MWILKPRANKCIINKSISVISGGWIPTEVRNRSYTKKAKSPAKSMIAWVVENWIERWWWWSVVTTSQHPFRHGSFRWNCTTWTTGAGHWAGVAIEYTKQKMKKNNRKTTIDKSQPQDSWGGWSGLNKFNHSFISVRVRRRHRRASLPLLADPSEDIPPRHHSLVLSLCVLYLRQGQCWL